MLCPRRRFELKCLRGLFIDRSQIENSALMRHYKEFGYDVVEHVSCFIHLFNIPRNAGKTSVLQGEVMSMWRRIVFALNSRSLPESMAYDFLLEDPNHLRAMPC